MVPKKEGLVMCRLTNKFFVYSFRLIYVACIEPFFGVAIQAFFVRYCLLSLCGVKLILPIFADRGALFLYSIGLAHGYIGRILCLLLSVALSKQIVVFSLLNFAILLIINFIDGFDELLI